MRYARVMVPVSLRALRQPVIRAHDFFICSEVQKLVLKIIKQHESAK